MNLLKKRITAKEKLCGTHVSLTDPCLCEIMGNVGFDVVWIDMEHTYMSCKDVLSHLNAARSSGISSVVRLPQNDFTVTKKILEMGPDGIIFPMVRNAKEANELIKMTLYPPLGNRGFGPMRAIKYGVDDAKQYVDSENLDLCRFIQIEHIDCIDDLEEILKNPFIDGFLFGPNDLSASIGDFLNVFDEKTVSLIQRAIDLLKRNGKYVGLSGGMDEKAIEFWQGLGIDILFAGADWNYICSAARETLQKMRTKG